jgi:SAM-dependent methyltransferase
MSGVETGPTPSTDRATWIRELRRVDEEQEEALPLVYDARWGEIEETHRSFVARFLSMLPPRAGVLDAACGTGSYFPLVLASGRSVLGVDHSGASLAAAAVKFPDVPTAKHDLQDLPYVEEFHGVMCLDAMEFVPPEDHHHPTLHRVRAWVTEAGFVIEEEEEGPWHEDGYAYHHVLARSEDSPR